MTRTTIRFADGIFNRVRAHLLPRSGACEEAAVLFTRGDVSAGGLELAVIETMLIPPAGFTSRSRFYLELTDETKALVIKRAHDLGAGLIECHSHPGQRGACFSWSDLHGFDEFVPHVQWRLPGRAYAAIVFAIDSIDALAWVHSRANATPVDAVHADGNRVEPTQLTLTNWSDIYEHSPL